MMREISSWVAFISWRSIPALIRRAPAPRMMACSAPSLLTVAAQEPVPASVVQVETASDNGETISPRADDVIVVRYRYFNGKLQYRHWNQTDQTWVEPDWIDV